ncbi:MAG: hypothetical protein A2293_07500 [Elusimicrobia bacterium RIFOXYB2_FULL_49_7]|nr:MAG: hypothetical protein A2293_07500 [Elusimicrobia bacterium RIFOXYB2_FULL_49_7]
MPIKTNHDRIEQIIQGVQEGVAQALLRHKRDGHSIAVWRNGRVEEIPPKNIRIPASNRRPRKAAGKGASISTK